MMNLPKDIEAKVQSLISRNRKVEAIKLIKDATGCGLKEAKEFSDRFDSDGQTFVQPQTNVNIEDELMTLIKQGKKLEAIKLYKDATNKSLADCKTHVDNLEQRTQALQKGSSPRSIGRDTQIDDILNAQKPQSKSGCFIATACYDDYHAPEVWLLRQYRDERLQGSVVGRLFIKLYYAVSPAIARQLNRWPNTKLFVKQHVLNRLINRILS